MTDNVAVLAGYTKEVDTNSGTLDLHLLIMPGTDTDDTFKVWDMDEQAFVLVNGWLFTFENV